MKIKQLYLWKSAILTNLIFSLVLAASAEAQTSTAPSPLESPFTADEAKAGQEAWAKHLGKQVVEKNTIGMELVLIPPGKFRMGSPEDEEGRYDGEAQVDVTLTQTFRMGRTEVTQGQWEQIMGTTPWKGKELVKEGADYPATNVSWDDAQAFCEKLSQKEGKTYQLPTEAEWEWSCRGGTTTRFSIPNGADLKDYAWFRENARDVNEIYPHRVGLKRPNPFGLSDMHGNVFEWCQDWYGERYSTASTVDPFGPSSGKNRVLRGGCWILDARYTRAAYRGHNSPDGLSEFVGFRVSMIHDSMPITPKMVEKPSPLESPFTLDEAKAGQEAWAKHLGKKVVEKNTIGMELVLIPPGKFRMGSPEDEVLRRADEKQVEVTLTQPFWLGQTEVTQGQWEKVMGTTPWKGKDFLKEGSDYPATYVSWEDVKAFCEKLSQKEGKSYRLPTEAQWEWSCRGGTTTRFSIPSGADLMEYAWLGDNAWDADEKYPHRVGLKRPNPFGLSDMHGNVFEWCQDWYGERYSTASTVDPFGPSSGKNRVFRGGGWSIRAWDAFSARRLMDKPGARSNDVGFRVSMIHEAMPIVPKMVEKFPSMPIAPKLSEKPASLESPFTADKAKAGQEAWARHLAKSVVEKNSIGMDLVLIPPGYFRMGSPKDEEGHDPDEEQVDVTLTQPFWLGKSEVTQSEFELVTGRNPSRFSKKDGNIVNEQGGLNFARFPVEYVSWYDAVDFCNKLSNREGLRAYYKISNIMKSSNGIEVADVSEVGGNGYRLPTEAEWEYSCRAGTTSAFHFGDVSNGLQANIDGTSPYGTTVKGIHLSRPTAVSSYSANSFGILDMHGNVLEWCQDWYVEKYSKAKTVDPFGPASGKYRVLRGGCWLGNAVSSRSSTRFWLPPRGDILRANIVGFRVSRTESP